MAQILLLNDAFSGDGASWSAQFDLPQEPPEAHSDKIYFFAPPQSCGGEMTVNGHVTLRFGAGVPLFFDLTGLLHNTEANRMCVEFYDNHAWQGEVGIRMTRLAYLESVQAETIPGTLYLRLVICTQAPGSYRLRIRIQQDDNPIAGFNVDVNLVADAREITVKVPMPDAQAWHPGSEAPAYRIHLFLQRDGLVCDSAQTAAVFGSLRFADECFHDGLSALFLCAAVAQDDDIAPLDLWRHAGINAVVAPVYASVNYLYACMRAGMVLLTPDGALCSGGFAANRDAAVQKARLAPLGTNRRTRPQLLRSRIGSMRMMRAAGVLLSPPDIPLCADALFTPSVWLTASRQGDMLTGRVVALLPEEFSGRLYVQARFFDAAGARLNEVTFQPAATGGGLVNCGRLEVLPQAVLVQLSIFVSGRMIAFATQLLSDMPPASGEGIHFSKSGGVCYLSNDTAQMQCDLYLTDGDGAAVLTSPALIDLRPWEKLPIRLIWPAVPPAQIQVRRA